MGNRSGNFQSEAPGQSGTGRLRYDWLTCAYAADPGRQRLFHPDVLEDVYAVPRKALSEPSTVARPHPRETAAGCRLCRLRRPFRPLFELLVGTGVRLGEAEALRPADLKIQGDGASRAIIRDSKTPDGVRAVFVPGWVRDSLLRHIEERRIEPYEALFPFKRRTIQSEHKRACGLAGIEGYTIHDHRHTAAVHLARSGMPLNLLQQQLGHSRVEQTMQYARFHPDYGDVKEYFERVEKRLGLVDSGNSPGNTYESSPETTDQLEL